MTEEAKERPEGKGGVAEEKAANGGAEAGGRSRQLLLYTCWACGSANYVDPNWTWFTCWRCGGGNQGM